MLRSPLVIFNGTELLEKKKDKINQMVVVEKIHTEAVVGNRAHLDNLMRFYAPLSILIA